MNVRKWLFNNHIIRIGCRKKYGVLVAPCLKYYIHLSTVHTLHLIVHELCFCKIVKFMTITWWGGESARTKSRAVNTVHYKFRFVLIMLQRKIKKNEDEKEELVNQVIVVFFAALVPIFRVKFTFIRTEFKYYILVHPKYI